MNYKQIIESFYTEEAAPGQPLSFYIRSSTGVLEKSDSIE